MENFLLELSFLIKYPNLACYIITLIEALLIVTKIFYCQSYRRNLKNEFILCKFQFIEYILSKYYFNTDSITTDSKWISISFLTVS